MTDNWWIRAGRRHAEKSAGVRLPWGKIGKGVLGALGLGAGTAAVAGAGTGVGSWLRRSSQPPRRVLPAPEWTPDEHEPQRLLNYEHGRQLSSQQAEAEAPGLDALNRLSFPTEYAH